VIHRASTDRYANDLKFVESKSNETRLVIRKDGHLAVSQDVEFYSGTDITNSVKLFSVGLDSTGLKFVIRDEVAGVDRISIDADGNIAGIDQSDITGLVSILTDKQHTLTTESGQHISATVLDTFNIASDGDGNAVNSLLTAKAIEDWFEQLQGNLLMVSPGQAGPGFRVATISVASPSAVNVPSCAAVTNYITGRISNRPTTTEMNTAIDAFNGNTTLNLSAQDITLYSVGHSNANVTLRGTSYSVGLFVFFGMSVTAPGSSNSYRPVFASDVYLTNSSIWLVSTLSSKHPLTPIASTIDETAHSTISISSNLITETSLVDFVGIGSVTTSGVQIARPMYKLYGQSITETTDASFSWIDPGVADITAGFNSSLDNRLATMACTHAHISAQVTAATISPTFTGTVALPSSDSITIDGTTLTDTIEDHTHSELQIKTGTTHVTTLYSNSYIQSNQQNLNGLAAVFNNSGVLTYRPMFCSEIYTGGSTTSLGETLTSRLAVKLDLPSLTFVWPSAVTDIKLDYLGDVTSNIQAQINAKQNPITIDSAPVIGNTTNLVSSDGIATWVNANYHPVSTVDTAPDDNTSHLITSKAVFDALALKQDSGSYLTESLAASTYNTVTDTGTQIANLATVYEQIVTTVGFSSNRASTGVYSITFTTTQISANYTIMLTLEHSQASTSSKVDDDYIIAYNSKAATGFSVKITEQDNGTSAGTSRNNRFDFLCIKSGRIICHGSVSSAGVAD
jgi:hypothetical protein